MNDETRITTGVDALLDLVKSRKRISINDVAKKLNISKTLAEAWATLLHEQGILDIQYKFSGTFLILKTREEDDEEEETQKAAHTGFVKQRSDNIWLFLDKLDAKIMSLEKEFKKHNLKNIHNELSILKELEEERDGINKQLTEERQKAISELKKTNQQLMHEKERAQEMMNELKDELIDEDSILSLEKTQLEILKRNQEKLRIHLKRLKKSASNKAKKISVKEKVELARSERELLEIEEHIQEFEHSFKQDNERHAKLLEKLDKRERILQKTKREVIKKMKSYRAGFADKQWKELEALLDERHYISSILKNLRHEERSLRERLVGIKSSGRKLAAEKELTNLEEKLKKIVNRRDKFEKRVSSLIHHEEKENKPKNSKKAGKERKAASKKGKKRKK